MMLCLCALSMSWDVDILPKVYIVKVKVDTLECNLMYGFLLGVPVKIIKNDSVLVCAIGYLKVLYDQLHYISNKVGRIVEIITDSCADEISRISDIAKMF